MTRLHPKVTISPKTVSILIAVISLAGILFSGCTNYYNATVQGFIKDAESSAGIDGVTIYLFDTEPAEDLAPETYPDESFTSISTSTQNGQEGFYSSRVFWENSFGRFWPEADSGTIYLIASHPDYETTRYTHKGVLSDGTNTIPDVLMERARLKAPIIEGRVIIQNGSGQNGVQVVLTQDDDPENEYAIRTADNDTGAAGYYRFENVSWLTEDGSKETGFTITIDDEDFESSASINQVVKESTTEDEVLPVSEDITLIRKPRTGFSTTISGYVYRTTGGGDEQPVSGIGVSVSYSDTDTSVDPTVYTGRTGVNGRFNILVSWEDTSPGDYGDANAADTADPGIPAGEDGLTVSVIYTNEGTGNLAPDFSTVQSFDISSHLDPFTLPDVEVVP